VIAAGYARQFWTGQDKVPNNSAVQPGVSGSEQRPAETIPYAPAIAAGVWLSLVPKA
jgi:hypothetical protein